MALLLAQAAGLLTLVLIVLLLHGAGVRLRLAHQRRRQQPLPLVVTARRELDAQLFALTLARPDGGRLPGFRAGQYLALLAPAGSDGALLRRCYSLAAWQPRPRQYELCIKREDEGQVSRFLHAALRPGTHLTALPPTGPFHLQRPQTEAVVLMAGGVGITPMRAMLQALLRRHPRTRVLLFQSARHEAGLAYADEFRALAARHPQFSYHPVLSRPPAGWGGAGGRLTAAQVLAALAGRTATFYQCAAAAFMADLRAGLEAAGVSPAAIHEEAFALAVAGAAPQAVLLDGRALAYPGEGSLLQALNAQGAGIASECRTGHCGGCRLRLAEGEVRWQAPAGCAVAEGEILACLCVPLSPLVLTTPR